MSDVIALSALLRHAYTTGKPLAPPSASDPALDLATAYAVEREFVRGRRASGHKTAGYKVGFANRAMWRALKLETVLWAHMYDDTVRFATAGESALSLAHPFAPKIEPEIVFKMKAPVAEGVTDPVAVLRSAEWLALGYEIIDCPFPDWKFQPVDFIAAFGFHAGLIVGSPLHIDGRNADAIAEQLSRFTLRLSKDDQLVEEGSGSNVLRSPALCLIELAAAIARRQPDEILQAGDLVTTGSLTAAQLLGSRGTWRAEAAGLEVAPLTLAWSPGD